MSKRWELLLAYEDQTWETEIFDLPRNVEPGDVNDWFVREGPGTTRAYRKVILAALYSACPQERDD